MHCVEIINGSNETDQVYILYLYYILLNVIYIPVTVWTIVATNTNVAH